MRVCDYNIIPLQLQVLVRYYSSTLPENRHLYWAPGHELPHCSSMSMWHHYQPFGSCCHCHSNQMQYSCQSVHVEVLISKNTPSQFITHQNTAAQLNNYLILFPVDNPTHGDIIIQLFTVNLTEIFRWNLPNKSSTFIFILYMVISSHWDQLAYVLEDTIHLDVVVEDRLKHFCLELSPLIHHSVEHHQNWCQTHSTTRQ